MRFAICVPAMLCLLSVEPALTSDEIDAATRSQWRQVFDGVAADYKLVREANNQSLALVDRATYLWARPGPQGGTYGAVYVWTNRGNAESVACVDGGATGEGAEGRWLAQEHDYDVIILKIMLPGMGESTEMMTAL